jgi:hypothetical protein
VLEFPGLKPSNEGAAASPAGFRAPVPGPIAVSGPEGKPGHLLT